MLEFEVVRTRGPAAALHERPIPDPARPLIWWHDVTAPALVLGSAQDLATIDLDACERAGVDVVRRRSGGGAVLLVPGEVVWFDVIVPTGAVTAVSEDVRRSMVWLGEHLRTLLGRGTVHERGLVSSPWSKVVCFDGLGPGELLVDGAKLTGISQRRTREAARFQVCWHTSYDPASLPALLSHEHRPPVDALRPVAILDRATLPADTAERLRATLSADLTA